MIMLNQTAHVIMFGGNRLIPSTPVDLALTDDDLKLYPHIKDMMDSGEIKAVTKKQAKEQVEQLEEKTTAELKAYAKSKGIELKAGASKGDIVEAIKAYRGV